MSIAVFTSIYSLQHSAYGTVSSDAFVVKAPIAMSGNNIYAAWPNNDTGHWDVFFAKSTDGGKTLGKTMMLSAPNNGNVVHLNVDIAASGVTSWSLGRQIRQEY